MHERDLPVGPRYLGGLTETGVSETVSSEVSSSTSGERSGTHRGSQAVERAQPTVVAGLVDSVLDHDGAVRTEIDRRRRREHGRFVQDGRVARPSPLCEERRSLRTSSCRALTVGGSNRECMGTRCRRVPETGG